MRKLTDFSSCGNEKGIDCYFIPAAVAEAADRLIDAAEEMIHTTRLTLDDDLEDLNKALTALEEAAK